MAAKELLLLVKFVTERAILPEFVTLSVRDVELPILIVPKGSADVDSAMAAAPVPVPVKLICDGLPIALCITEIVAAYVRNSVGENVTVTV